MPVVQAQSTSEKITALLESGRKFISDKRPSQARPLFVEAWNEAVNAGEDYLAIDAAVMMAEIEPRKQQQEWIERGIELAERSPKADAKKWLGALYTNMAWRYYNLRRYDLTLEAFDKALSHLKSQQGSEREVFVARWSIGKVYRVMGRTEDALAVQNSLLAELGIGGVQDGRLYEELAECLHTLKRSTEARVYFDLAYRELSREHDIESGGGGETNGDIQPSRLKRLKDLGKEK